MPTDKQSLRDLPGELIEQLRIEDGATPLVPRSADQAILDRARAQFGSRGTPRRRWFQPAAAAAGVMLATALLVQVFHAPTQPQTIADDIDGSGTVDVLDAFLLARQGTNDPSITEARVDALLTRIVSISSRGDHQT